MPFGKGGKRAKARHILVKTKEECLELKAKIEQGDDFSALAKVTTTVTASCC
jgi:parvulin-like peptidyl-prolyl isomerase